MRGNDMDIAQIETFHTDDGLNLHFRLMGCYEGRYFNVNVQLDAEDERTGEALAPAGYGMALAKLMGLLSVQMAANTLAVRKHN